MPVVSELFLNQQTNIIMGSIRDFKHKYKINLLLVSDASLQVGLQAKYNHPILETGLEIRPFFVTDRLQFESEDETKFEELFQDIAKAEKQEAEIANYTLESTFDFDTALNIPSLGIDLSNEINYQKVQAFSYEGVKARVITTKVGRPLVKKLADIQKNDKKWWRQIDGFYFVEKIYYADKVTISTDSEYAAQLKAKWEGKLPVDFNIKVTGTNKSKIEFSGASEVPFAAKIEIIRDYLKQ